MHRPTAGIVALSALVALPVLLALAAPALAQQPTQAQASAIRSACRGDYMNVCASVPTGGKEALECLEQHAGQVSAGCRSALAAVSPPPATAAPVPAPAASAASLPPLPPPRPMSPREEFRLLRTDCGPDYRKFCPGVQLGGGRGLACLHAHGPQLSRVCHSALLAAAQGR